MRLPRLTYVGHSYHQRTGSTVFVQDLLRTRFEVTTVLDDSWLPGRPPLRAAEVNRTGPERLVFFQQLPRRRELARLACNNITWMPMHDSLARYRPCTLAKLRPAGLKTLCFSSTDSGRLSAAGFETQHLRYYPPPGMVPRSTATDLSIFFWMRTPNIGWRTVKALLGTTRPARVVLRAAPDPGHKLEMPTPAERAEYRVEVHEGWMELEEYRRLLTTCSVFVAPRPREGIGQAALEAMAAGLAVVAPNLPTMNEYIEPGVNGYLYDLAAPAPVDFGDLARVRERARTSCEEGHARWLATAPALLEFVDAPPRRPRSRLWQAWYRLR
jgi:hypothetical protein